MSGNREAKDETERDNESKHMIPELKMSWRLIQSAVGAALSTVLYCLERSFTTTFVNSYFVQTENYYYIIIMLYNIRPSNSQNQDVSARSPMTVFASISVFNSLKKRKCNYMVVGSRQQDQGRLVVKC